MQYFKQDVYQRPTVKLPTAYVASMVTFLSKQFPKLSREEIETFVRAQAKAEMQRPKLSIINQPSEGNAEIVERDLLSYTDTMRANIITPSGTLYVKPSVKPSFLKVKINTNKKKRKLHKGLMLTAAGEGDLLTEQREHNIQGSVKIETNSIPGAMGSRFNVIFDLAGYNAVTSVPRHCIMAGYAHVEKLLEGNYYLTSLDDCINCWVQLIHAMPAHTSEILRKYNLYLPSADEVYDHFYQSLQFYQRITPSVEMLLKTFLQNLNVTERAFLFYAGCLKTLMQANDDFFRMFLQEFYRSDITIDETVAPEAIFKLNGDLRALVSSLNADVIERRAIEEAIRECPSGIQRLIAIGRHMQRCMDGISDLIATFLRIDSDTPNAMQHKNMLRKCVIISDTDSVIFSTQSWVEWYTQQKISFAPEAYQINGFVTMIITLTLEHLFARLSTNIGIEGDDIYQISMKNEFLYPLMMRTPLPKQYCGIAAIQEGFVLPKLKKDTKGLSFRSSTMCAETVQAGEDFRSWMFESVMRDGSIKASDCFAWALKHERRVIDSLEAGERTFLTSTPVREEDDYVDPDVAVYYYWKLWQSVFQPVFGDFVIPGKGYVLPLLKKGAIINDPQYLQRLCEFDPALYERLMSFMGENKRKITRLIIPMTIRRVPEILRPLIDIRGIVFANSTPFIVALRSLGLGYTHSKDMTLLSDTYG